MMTLGICEDNSIQREEVRGYLKKMMLELGYDHRVLVYESGEQLLNNYPTDVEILFLDIQMAGISGIEVAKKIRTFNQEVAIIFLTGDPGYMQMGYEVDARRYLLKPITYRKFYEQVSPCVEKLIAHNSHYIWIKSEYSDYKIRTNDIYYAEKNGHKLIIHTPQKQYETCMSMKQLEEKLSEDTFVRCHKSFYVNLKHIIGLEKDGIRINNQYIPVRRQALKMLKTQLVEVLGDKLC